MLKSIQDYMSRFFRLTFPILLGSVVSSGYILPQDRRYVDYFLRLESADLFRMRSFLLKASSSRVTSEKLEGVSLSFDYYRALTLEEARRILISVAEQFIKKINANPILKEKKLIVTPFTIEQLHLEIHLDNVISTNIDASTIQKIILDKGIITYETFRGSSFFRSSTEIYSETFQFALMSLNIPTEFDPKIGSENDEAIIEQERGLGALFQKKTIDTFSALERDGISFGTNREMMPPDIAVDPVSSAQVFMNNKNFRRIYAQEINKYSDDSKSILNYPKLDLIDSAEQSVLALFPNLISASSNPKKELEEISTNILDENFFLSDMNKKGIEVLENDDLLIGSEEKSYTAFASDIKELSKPDDSHFRRDDSLLIASQIALQDEFSQILDPLSFHQDCMRCPEKIIIETINLLDLKETENNKNNEEKTVSSISNIPSMADETSSPSLESEILPPEKISSDIEISDYEISDQKSLRDTDSSFMSKIWNSLFGKKERAETLEEENPIISSSSSLETEVSEESQEEGIDQSEIAFVEKQEIMPQLDEEKSLITSSFQDPELFEEQEEVSFSDREFGEKREDTTSSDHEDPLVEDQHIKQESSSFMSKIWNSLFGKKERAETLEEENPIISSSFVETEGSEESQEEGIDQSEIAFVEKQEIMPQLDEEKSLITSSFQDPELFEEQEEVSFSDREFGEKREDTTSSDHEGGLVEDQHIKQESSSFMSKIWNSLFGKKERAETLEEENPIISSSFVETEGSEESQEEGIDQSEIAFVEKQEIMPQLDDEKSLITSSFQDPKLFEEQEEVSLSDREFGEKREDTTSSDHEGGLVEDQHIKQESSSFMSKIWNSLFGKKERAETLEEENPIISSSSSLETEVSEESQEEGIDQSEIAFIEKGEDTTSSDHEGGLVEDQNIEQESSSFMSKIWNSLFRKKEPQEAISSDNDGKQVVISPSISHLSDDEIRSVVEEKLE